MDGKLSMCPMCFQRLRFLIFCTLVCKLLIPSEHEAIKIGHDAIRKQCQVQIDLAKELGVVKREYNHERSDEDLQKAIHAFCYDKAYAVAKSSAPKHERSAAFKQVLADFIASLPEGTVVDKFLAKKYYHDVTTNIYLLYVEND